MKLDAFSIVVLLGALQALFFSIYLFFSSSDNKLQNRTLAFFIFILSYNGFETLNWSSELSKYIVFFEFFPFILVFGLGPSIYLYVKSFRRDISGKAWPHFLWSWAMLLIRLSILGVWLYQKNGGFSSVDVDALDYWYGTIAEPLSAFVFTAYLVFALREYRLLVSGENNWTAEERHITVRWLKTLLIVMTVFSALWIFTVVIPSFFDVGDQKYYLIEIALVVFVYWIGYAGYHRSRIIYTTRQKKSQPYLGGLTAEAVEHCLKTLDGSMETEKLYLDPELNLNILAARIGVPPKMLSSVLNQVLQKGFSEYVNAWRVEAVKEMIVDPSKRHMTIAGIAFDCGFNSQPTFQRAFKAITGQTPKDYLQNNSQIRN